MPRKKLMPICEPIEDASALKALNITGWRLASVVGGDYSSPQGGLIWRAAAVRKTNHDSAARAAFQHEST